MITLMIKAFLLGWLITNFQPLKQLIKKLPQNAFTFYFQMLTGCIKCCSFWVCLILSGNIFLAAGTAFIAYWYDYLLAPKITLNK